MKSNWTYSYHKLKLEHHKQQRANVLLDSQEKAQLFNRYRADYARLTNEDQRAYLLRQFTQAVLQLKQLQDTRRIQMMRRHQTELEYEESVGESTEFN